MVRVLLLAAPLFAQVPMDAVQTESLASLSETVKSIRGRLAPPRADAKAVATLFERLAKDGERTSIPEGVMLSYDRVRPEKDGGKSALSIRLIEVPVDEPNGPVRDLVYRRQFSRMEGVSQRTTPQADGSLLIDEWKYTLSTDGRILKAEHNTVTLLGTLPDGSLLRDPKRSTFLTMPTRDPEVLRRWEGMQREFLTLGRVTEV